MFSLPSPHLPPPCPPLFEKPVRASKCLMCSIFYHQSCQGLLVLPGNPDLYIFSEEYNTSISGLKFNCMLDRRKICKHYNYRRKKCKIYQRKKVSFKQNALTSAKFLPSPAPFHERRFIIQKCSAIKTLYSPLKS